MNEDKELRKYFNDFIVSVGLATTQPVEELNMRPFELKLLVPLEIKDRLGLLRSINEDTFSGALGVIMLQGAKVVLQKEAKRIKEEKEDAGQAAKDEQPTEDLG